MDIGNILSRAWQITWKYKVLWIFGILAGCGNVSGNSSNAGGSQGQNQEQFSNMVQGMDQGVIIAIVIALIIIALVLAAIAIFLGAIGRIGLIRGTLQADQGAASLTFSELFNGSIPYFWRVFGLNLVVGMIVFLGFILIAVIGILGTVFTLGVGLVCLIPLICLLVPLSWLIEIVIQQSNIAIVVENLGIGDGLRRGWEVVTKNLGSIIVMGLILVIGVGLIGGILIGLPLAALFTPLMVAAISGSQETIGTGAIVSGICLIGYIPVMLVVGGILQTFSASAWTLTYLRLTGRSAAL